MINDKPICLFSLNRTPAKIPRAMIRMSSKMKPNLTCGTITSLPEDSISYKDKNSNHQ